MCGIAAILRIKPNLESRILVQDIDLMIDRMKYRGPDAKGTFLDKELGAVGHARLSIIDLDERANQPFFSEDRQSCVVFNGEIFNFKEIRQRLKRERGIAFKTESDTEVLLAAYDAWGENCVNDFNGMWAFVILDKRNKKVFCSRDRFGIKPFLYAVSGNQIFVASEAKAILAVAPEFRRPNFKALSLLLRASVGGQNHDTCFEGIKRLPPSHNLVIQDGDMKIQRYWEYPLDSIESREVNMEVAVDEFRELFDDSVRLWSQSDVPVGFSLSGGLDSSAILSSFRLDTLRKTKSYTATYSHPNYRADESATAAKLSMRFGVENTRVDVLSTDLEPIMKKIVEHLEAPHAAEPMLAYWKIMEVAKKDVRVMIEGQGADELLAGYANTVALPVLKASLQKLNFAECFRTIARGATGAFGNSPSDFFSMLIRSMFPFLHHPYRILRGDDKVYSNELANICDDFYQVPRSQNHKDLINRILVSQHENGLVNLLQYSDSITMAHSIEGRVPFLDHRLVEFSFRLPGTSKFNEGFTKYILRKSMKERLPDFVVNEPRKRGFDLPTQYWLSDSMDSLVRPILHSQSCRQRGLFDQSRMTEVLSRHESNQHNFSSQIFRWILTELWFQHFID
jgi:asparagine synthase (glutamine-hydrolysing)